MLENNIIFFGSYRASFITSRSCGYVRSKGVVIVTRLTLTKDDQFVSQMPIVRKIGLRTCLLRYCWREPNVLAIGSHLQKWHHDMSSIVATHLVYSLVAGVYRNIVGGPLDRPASIMRSNTSASMPHRSPQHEWDKSAWRTDKLV